MKWKYPTSSRWNCPKIYGHHLGFILKLEVSHGFATSKHSHNPLAHPPPVRSWLPEARTCLGAPPRKTCGKSLFATFFDYKCLQIFTGSLLLLNVWANYANSMPMGWLSLLDLIFDITPPCRGGYCWGVPTIGYELGCTFWWNATAVFVGWSVEKTTWILVPCSRGQY